jgi:hypothetical protein
VDHELHRQLGDRVLDGEQHLLVVLRARPLRGEQHVEIEIAAVRGPGGELGHDAMAFL